MWTKEYQVLNINGLKAYFRKDRIPLIKQVDGIIFDCDGVLVDVRDSYNKAISKTVAYIIQNITCTKMPEELVSNEVIFLFRRTGGFNNDWDTVYGILMFVLSSLPDNYKTVLKRQMERVDSQQDPFTRLLLVRRGIKKEIGNRVLDTVFFEETFCKLKEFTNLLDESGIASVDKNLAGKYAMNEDFTSFYNFLKGFIYMPAEVGKSIIATVFEEFFQGSRLFNQTFGIQPSLNNELGMIENEKLIIKPEVLDKLALILGEKRLGIASGSRIEPAKYVLKGLLSKFNPDATIFLEKVEDAEHKFFQEKGLHVNLKKPAPYSLLKAAEGFGNYKCIIYVGDSTEEALMVKEASKTCKNIMFAGVYQHSGLEDLIKDGFLKLNCDMVIPSVNDLPFIIEAFKRE